MSVTQLRAARLDSAAVTRRVRAGRLHRVHRGVYAVGHAGLSRHGRWMAAVLAYGASAALSHRSAAELWNLLPARRTLVDVSVPGASGRTTRPGIRLHRSRTLTTGDITLRYGIPVTRPARTIADLRSTVTPATLRRVAHQAAVLGLRTDGETAPPETRSEFEDAFLQLCARHRLPRPEINVRVGPIEVDFLWRDRRLIVETDGYRYHRGRTAFEKDHSRDLRLRALGFDVMRLTYRQVMDEPEHIAAMLQASL